MFNSDEELEVEIIEVHPAINRVSLVCYADGESFPDEVVSVRRLMKFLADSPSDRALPEQSPPTAKGSLTRIVVTSAITSSVAPVQMSFDDLLNDATFAA